MVSDQLNIVQSNNLFWFFQTEASSVCAIKTTEKVIKFLEECDSPQQTLPQQEQAVYTECMDLSYTMTH